MPLTSQAHLPQCEHLRIPSQGRGQSRQVVLLRLIAIISFVEFVPSKRRHSERQQRHQKYAYAEADNRKRNLHAALAFFLAAFIAR
jgi:hypothetical protein